MFCFVFSGKTILRLINFDLDFAVVDVRFEKSVESPWTKQNNPRRESSLDNHGMYVHGSVFESI